MYVGAWANTSLNACTAVLLVTICELWGASAYSTAIDNDDPLFNGSVSGQFSVASGIGVMAGCVAGIIAIFCCIAQIKCVNTCTEEGTKCCDSTLLKYSARVVTVAFLVFEVIDMVLDYQLCRELWEDDSRQEIKDPLVEVNVPFFGGSSSADDVKIVDRNARLARMLFCLTTLSLFIQIGVKLNVYFASDSDSSKAGWSFRNQWALHTLLFMLEDTTTLHCMWKSDHQLESAASRVNMAFTMASALFAFCGVLWYSCFSKRLIIIKDGSSNSDTCCETACGGNKRCGAFGLAVAVPYMACFIFWFWFMFMLIFSDMDPHRDDPATNKLNVFETMAYVMGLLWTTYVLFAAGTDSIELLDDRDEEFGGFSD